MKASQLDSRFPKPQGPDGLQLDSNRSLRDEFPAPFIGAPDESDPELFTTISPSRVGIPAVVLIGLLIGIGNMFSMLRFCSYTSAAAKVPLLDTN